MATSEKSPHYVRYVELLTQLHALVRVGKGDSPEADALRDEMDEPWCQLPAEETAEIRRLSAQLNSQRDVDPPRMEPIIYGFSGAKIPHSPAPPSSAGEAVLRANTRALKLLGFKRLAFIPHRLQATPWSRPRPPRVFVSYAHEDRDAVLNMVERLAVAGVSTWLDSGGFRAGAPVLKQMDEAIRDSDAVLLCLSTRSVSATGFLPEELGAVLQIAATRRPEALYLIPVRLNQVTVPAEVDLYDDIDYFLPDGPERLVSALRALESVL